MSRTPRRPRSGDSNWKRRRESVMRCKSEGTWPGWIHGTIDTWRSGAGGVTGDVAGNRLNNAPEWSGRAWIDWTRSIGRATAFVARRRDVENDGVLHAIQRQHPAAGAIWTAGRRRRVRADASPLGRLCVYGATSPTRTTSPGQTVRLSPRLGAARAFRARWVCNWRLSASWLPMRRILISAVCLSLAFASSSAAQPDARRVLILHSFEIEFAPDDALRAHAFARN